MADYMWATPENDCYYDMNTGDFYLVEMEQELGNPIPEDIDPYVDVFEAELDENSVEKNTIDRDKELIATDFLLLSDAKVDGVLLSTDIAKMEELITYRDYLRDMDLTDPELDVPPRPEWIVVRELPIGTE